MITPREYWRRMKVRWNQRLGEMSVSEREQFEANIRFWGWTGLFLILVGLFMAFLIIVWVVIG